MNASESSYRRWLHFAREDLTAAEKLMEPPERFPRQACFNAHQAAEKALKAALIYLEMDFAFRHDLEYLNSLLPDLWQFDPDEVDLEQLTAWVVAGRYPGDMVPAVESDAWTAITHARQILESIETRLALES